MPKLHEFEEKIAADWPPPDWQDNSLLLAVSGGPDSVAMLRALASLKRTGTGTLHAAHVHHGLRCEQADNDQRFVEQLCGSLNIPCHTQRVDVHHQSAVDGDGLEAAARRLRYRFLQQQAETLGARYVVTAHTADDQAETILHRIVRGTGLTGLAGIPRTRPLGPTVSLIRPILTTWRHDVLNYLAELNQAYREDISNRDTSFTRNRIRHDLLPGLAEQYNRHVRDALCRLGVLSREACRVIDTQVDPLWDRCVADAAADAVTIRTAPLAQVDRYLIRELLMRLWRRRDWPQQKMGFEQWELLAGLVQSPTALVTELSLPGGVRVKTNNQGLRLERTQTTRTTKGDRK